MKVVYRPRGWRAAKDAATSSERVLVLQRNNWDDFGYKTTLGATLVGQSQVVELGNLKILVRGQSNTATYFDSLIEAGWDGSFPPPPEVDYISNPSAITFYEQLRSFFDVDEFIWLLGAIRDAGYLTRVREDELALKMLPEAGFKDSLQRERGDKKAFADGWKLLSHPSLTVDNFSFSFRDKNRVVQTLDFLFSSSSPLPHDINVLIGPNGSGKSHFFSQLIERWLDPVVLDFDIGFSPTPNLSQIVALSYSPFERLPVDSAAFSLADTDVYRYFGLRGRERPVKKNAPLPRVTLSLEHARRDAANSLIDCAVDDQRYAALEDWSKKVSTLESVLKTAIDFEFAAVEVPTTLSAKAIQLRNQEFYNPFIDFVSTDARGTAHTQRFVKVTTDVAPSLNTDALITHAIPLSGVSLFKDGEVVELSSGQKLFTYIVINLLGSIRRNSLVLIDEPELFLHPTLEISLISMLKSILERFACKALIATHSEVLVREIPRDCVHVFEMTADGLIIKSPPFQTFGGDVQRISTYVFGDRSISKPFEKWIDDELATSGSKAELLRRVGKDLNEELIMELSSRAGEA